MNSGIRTQDLQTNAHNTNPNVVQRHNANKQVLERFYTEIRNSLTFEGKFHKMQETEFTEWYKKPRYWDVCKYKSNDENNDEFELAKIKVTNRQFLQITEDHKQIAFDLRSTQAIVIQPKTHNDYLTQTIKLCKEIEHDYQTENNVAYQQEIKAYRERSNQFFGLFVRWHFQGATSRICVLVKDKLDKDRMLFIYNRQSESNEKIEEARINTSFLDSKQTYATYMKEIIKVHHCKQINQKQLQRYKRSFLQGLKWDFHKKIDEVFQQQRKNQTRIMGNKTLAQAFTKYDRYQSQSIINQWKSESGKALKAKQLYIEVLQIWIDKSKVSKTVILNLSCANKGSKEESFKKQYVYKRTEGQYHIFQLPSQEKYKCVPFQLQSDVFSKQININVVSTGTDSVTTKYFNRFSHFKLQGKDAFTHQLTLYEEVFRQNVSTHVDCFIFLKTEQSRRPNLESLDQQHQRSFFDNVGVIPTKYKNSLKIQYNPNTYPLLRELVSHNSSPKITKESYQQCYYQLVSFIQAEENKSQLSLSNLDESSIANKCPMRERLTFYEKQILKQIGQIDTKLLSSKHFSLEKLTREEKKLMGYFTMLDENLYIQLNGNEFSLEQIQYKNLCQDLEYYKPLNELLVKQVLVKYIYFTSRIKRLKQFGNQLRYVSNLVPILQKYIAVVFNSKLSVDEQMLSRERYTIHFLSFILFIGKIYPYGDYNTFRNDLFILRAVVQKYLPNYNDYLNRSNVGLQNLVGWHLLNLFTELSEELTFRIWDFIISSQNQMKARLTVAFTLLTYFQATNNLPIIPINQFMGSVQQNFGKLSVSMQLASKEGNAAEAYFGVESVKSKRLQKLIKGYDKSIVEDKYLQRIILGQTILDEAHQSRIKAHYESNKVVQPINDLSYPLPKPNYFGRAVVEIVFFVHNLNILQNLNLVAQKYVLRFTVPLAKNKQKFEVFILSKNHFYNEAFRVQIENPQNFQNEKEEMKTIIVELVKKNNQKSQLVQLAGVLNYSRYHKDRAYKSLIVLSPKVKHNKGQTVLRVSFCLKSVAFNSKMQSKNFVGLETLSEKSLDYDIGKSNESVVILEQLQHEFQQIKNPLDEFSGSHNRRIQNCCLNFFQSEWIENSKTSIEQIKTIFYHIFPQEKQKDLRLQFSKIYEIFSQENNMQFIYLSQILTKLILSANITRKKKITYLYCLAVHYQNSYTKSVTSETLNSVMRLILKQRQIITACPYEEETCGRIVEAYFFGSSLKNIDEKNDITEILQDWAYICRFKYQYGGIILGSSRELTILRSLLDASTLKRLQSQPECRFEIIYQLQGNKYLWAVVVDSRTFTIVKRGTKFLNSFDGYADFKYLDSTQEYLLNCQNTIPLQVHRTYNYSQFTEILLENQLVKYALQMPAIFVKESQVKWQPVRLKDAMQDSRNSHMYANKDQKGELDVRIIDQDEQDSYDSWVLHRSQNCLQNWKKCSIVNPGPVLSEIKYPHDKELYTVNTIDLISMDEISLQNAEKN